MGNVCVVTGGAGFVGCAMSRGLVSRFDRVIALDNLHPQRIRPTALDPAIELVVRDVTDNDVWDDILSTVFPTTVIHLAAETGTGQSLTGATRHSQVNVVGTAALLDAFARRQRQPKRVILTSSLAIYGEGAWRSLVDGKISYPGQWTWAQLARAEWDFPKLEPLPSDAAKTTPAPVSIYGATKLAQEHMISAWAASYGSEFIILRLQNAGEKWRQHSSVRGRRNVA